MIDDEREIDFEVNKKAFDKAIAFLTRRDHTESEIQGKLSKSGFSETDIQAVIDKLAEYGYVNDEDFAKRYLDSLIQKGKGRFAIREAMNQKGLAASLVANTIEDGYSREKEFENAEKLANKVIDDNSDVKDTMKLTSKVNRRLLGRGFSYEIISDVMSCVRERIKNV